MTPAWRSALGGAAEHTRRFFDDGRGVCDGVSGRLKWELRLTWLKGTRILKRLKASRFDAFRNRPALGPGDGPLLVWRAVRWKKARI
jgi:hypothetical protein